MNITDKDSMGQKSLHPLFTYLLLLSLLSPSLVLSEDSIKELKRFVRAIREQKDKLESDDFQSIHLSEIDESPDQSGQICASCPQIQPITEQVNKIVRKLAEQEQEHPTLMEEVGKLEGMYHLTITGSWTPGEGPEDCYRTELGPSPLSEDNDFPEEYAIRLFDTNIDVDDIRTIEYFPDNKTRVYFFRGQGSDRDKVIRVIAGANKKAKVTYFAINNPNQRVRLPDMSGSREYKNDDSGEGKKDKRENMSFMFSSTLGVDNEDGEESKKLTEEQRNKLNRFLSAEFGVSIEDKDGIPRKLRLLDVHAGYRFSDQMKIQGQAQVDSDEQKVKLSVVDGKNKPYVEMEFEDSKATYRVPLQFQMNQSDWLVRGGLQGKVEGSDHRGELKLDLMSSTSQDEIYTTVVTEKNGRTRASFKHERNVGAGRMSIELGEDGQHWVRWKGRF